MKKVSAFLLCVIICLTGLLAGCDLSADSERGVLDIKNISGRQVIDLNSDWDFYLETLESNDESNYDVDSFKEIKNKKTVDLPHDWSIEQDFTKEYDTENESASLPGGVAWYSKKLSAQDVKNIAGKNVVLSFGGVYMRSYIFVNGEEVGSNLYGYNSFDIDISKYFEKAQDVEITVLVINQLPNSRWYSGSGIYRKVFLNVTEPVYVATNGTYVTTPDLSETFNGNASVRVDNEIKNNSTETQNISVKNEIYDDNGKLVTETETEKFEIKSGKTITKTLNLSVNKPELWSTDNAALYTVKTIVNLGDLVIDTYDTEFGFRWFDYDSEKGFLLNGVPTKLEGVCLHHDQGSLGANAYTDSIQRQLEIMKEMGVNAVRTSHNPASEDLIDLCNKMGILVIEESFDTWEGEKNEYDFADIFNKKLKNTNLSLIGAERCTWAEFIVKSMVKRDRNAPSIIMWSLGNEIQGKNSARNSRKLSSYAEELDPYELGGRKKIYAEDDIRSGIDKKWAKVIRGFSKNDSEGSNVSVAGVNYVDAGTFEKAHEEFPDIMMFSTESSSALRSRGEYFHPYEIKNDYNTDTQATENSQMSSYDNDVASWANSAMFDWQYDVSLDYVLGEFVWTGFDYLGEPTPFTDNSPDFYPTTSYFGITDTAGFEKDIYYFYQSQWRDADDQPVLHLLPTWDLDESQLDSNGNALVVCYTNAKSVELRAKKSDKDSEYISLGTKSFDTLKSSAGLREYNVNSDDKAIYKMALEWSIPYDEYKDYIIYAVPLNQDGSEDIRFKNSSGRNELKKSGNASEISLSQYEFKNSFENSFDDYNLYYINADLLDSEGLLDASYNQNIDFKVEGNAEIIGVDNGNSSDTDKSKYSDKSKINAFHGKALVIVKADKGAAFKLYAESGDLQSSIEIKG